MRGAVGYRSLRLTRLEDGQCLGLTGFGASGHLVLKIVRHRYPESRVYVFARSEAERVFARELGAAWAGDTLETAPEKLHAIIDTTPAWTPVVEALKNLVPGGRLVINAIRKEEDDKKRAPPARLREPALVRKGNQDRSQRHPGRRPRVLAACRADPSEARRARVSSRRRQRRLG